MSLSAPTPVFPFYFGSEDKQLFGCYQKPQERVNRDCAVLICQPMGHEYIYCHRALRQLSTRLANAGFPVLRFDFYGCGDSLGEGEDGTVAQWLRDVSTAIAEVKARAGVDRVCLVGVRLGASLAFAAAAQRMDVDSLVLWDPVVLGSVYLDELASLQKQAMKHRRRQSWTRSGLPTEVIGFPLPTRLRTELEQLDLLTIACGTQSSVLAINTWDSDNVALDHFVRTHRMAFEYRKLQAPKIWRPTIDGNLLVPSQLLQEIVTWTSKAHA